MGSYIVNVETPAGVIGSVLPDISLTYTSYLNEINNATLKLKELGD